MLAARRPSVAATEALLSLEVPTVAAVRGTALGGGLELALTCDLIVADTSAVLGLPETGVGIIPGGGGTQLLPRKIGIGRANELIFTGRRITAIEARGYGLVDVLSEGDASTPPCSLADDHRGEESRRRNAMRRPRCAEATLCRLADALDVEDGYWRSSALSADYREGLTAFSEKRSPRWPEPRPPTSCHSTTGVRS